MRAAVKTPRARKGVAGRRLEPASTARGAKPKPPSYFARLSARQPVPLSAQASRALDEADRGER
jgi:hypothetical protein